MTMPAPLSFADSDTTPLDRTFAEFLLRREQAPALLPSAFAATLPDALRAPFLAEVETLVDVDRLTATPAAGLPECIGRYRILARLGSGGTGTVYEAEQVTLGRRVAVKVLHAAASACPDAAQRFRREARLVASLHHESIVAVHDFEEIAGQPVLVMQLAKGASLRELLAARERAADPLHTMARTVLVDPRRIAATFAKIASALAHAHDRGVVHRDLKPANVVLDDLGHPTVLDFGFARSGDVDHAVTRRGDVLGTPLYMAPEQLAGETVGPAADLWALGSVLHECLTGHAAAGPRADSHDTIPEPLRRIVARCRERDPARRPPGAAAVAAELQSFANGRGGRRLPRQSLRRAFAVCAAAAACVVSLAALPAQRTSGPRHAAPSAEERLARLEAAVRSLCEDDAAGHWARRP